MYWTFGLRLSRVLVPELLDEANNPIKQLEASTHNVDSNAIIQSLNLLYTNSY
jgi:hypothetical protein